MPLTFSEFRKQYPEYNSIPKEELIELVNKKYPGFIITEKPFDWRNFVETVFPPVQLANVAYDVLTDNQAALAKRTEEIKQRNQRDEAFLRGAGDSLGANWVSARLSPFFGIGPSANAGSVDEAKEMEEAASRKAQTSHPGAYNLGQVFSGIVPTLPFGAPFAAAPLAGRALAAALGAAPIAAVQGAFSADALGDDPLAAAINDARIAAIVAAGVPVVGAAGRGVVNAVKDLTAPFTRSGQITAATRKLVQGLTGNEALTPGNIQPLIRAIDRQAERNAVINQAAGPGARRFQQTTDLAVGTPSAVQAAMPARLQNPGLFVQNAADNTHAINRAFENSFNTNVDPNVARQAFEDNHKAILAKADAELAAAQEAARIAAQNVTQAVDAAQGQAAAFRAKSQQEVINARNMPEGITPDVMEALAADGVARLTKLPLPADVQPRRTYPDIGSSARGIIRKVHDDVSRQARRLYTDIPQDAPVPGSHAIGEAARDALQRFEPNSPLLAKIAANVPEDLTSGDLLSIKRAANKMWREASASGDRPLAAQAQKIHAMADDLLTSPDTPREVSSALRAADDFFAENVAPFRRNELGGVTRMGRFGAQSATEPSITLKQFIRPDAQAGAERADELLHVIKLGGGSLKDDVRDYVGRLIAETAVKGGRMDAAAIRALLQSHAAFFQRFPEIGDGVTRLANRAQSADGKMAQALAKAEDSRKFAENFAREERNRNIASAQEKAAKMELFAQNQVSKVKTGGAQRLRAMQEAVESAIAGRKQVEAAARNSPAGIFVAHDPETAVNRIFSSPNPAESIGELLASARELGDDVVQGVKQAVSDWLSNRIHLTGRVGMEGGMTDFKLSAAQMEKLIGRNGKYRRALAEIYSPQELKLLDSIREEVSRPSLLANQATSGSATAERMSGAERTLGFAQQHSQRLIHVLSSAAGFGGYAAGGATPAIIGLAGVELLGYLRQQGRKRIQDLVNRAMVDPDLARTLLLNANDPRNISRLRQAFELLEANASKVGVGAAAVLGD